MSSQNMSPELMASLGKIVSADSWWEAQKPFLEWPRDVLVGMFPDREALCKIVQELALQAQAPVFEAIAEKFYQDDDVVQALAAGLAADIRYSKNHNDRSFGATPDAKDLERKRQALSRLVLRISKGDQEPSPVPASPPSPRSTRIFVPR